MLPNTLQPKTIILGATSGIAEACAHLWASQGHELYLVARDSQKLEALVKDLSTRYAQAKIHTQVLDLADTSQHKTLWSQIHNSLQKVDQVLVCFGILANEASAQENFAEIRKVYEVNTLAHISLLVEGEAHWQAGTRVGVVTSVAGDRGRFSNYVYGSSKAALSSFVSGLRARLFHKQIHVMDIRPGFVVTPMTQGFKRGGPLWAQPSKVAQDIARGLTKQCNILYTPKFWCLIMLIIKSIPEFIFKKLKL